MPLWSDGRVRSPNWGGSSFNRAIREMGARNSSRLLQLEVQEKEWLKWQMALERRSLAPLASETPTTAEPKGLARAKETGS